MDAVDAAESPKVQQHQLPLQLPALPTANSLALLPLLDGFTLFNSMRRAQFPEPSEKPTLGSSKAAQGFKPTQVLACLHSGLLAKAHKAHQRSMGHQHNTSRAVIPTTPTPLHGRTRHALASPRGSTTSLVTGAGSTGKRRKQVLATYLLPCSYPNGKTSQIRCSFRS